MASNILIKAIADSIGLIEHWPTSDVPTGRVKADASTFLRSSMPLLFAYLVKSGTATFTNGSVNVGMTAHGRSVNDPIKLFTTGALPTNFAAGTHGLVTVGTVFFVQSVIDANTVTLAATPGGSAISAGSAGSGTQTWVSAPHGDGDGSTTFTVPDYRGNFLRGLDNGAGVDANRSAGSLQTDAMQGHIHQDSGHAHPYTVNSAVSGGNAAFGTSTASGGTSSGIIQTSSANIGGPVTDGTHGTPRTAAETRSRNVAVLITIRFAV
jgi:hypothetical protein